MQGICGFTYIDAAEFKITSERVDILYSNSRVYLYLINFLRVAIGLKWDFNLMTTGLPMLYSLIMFVVYGTVKENPKWLISYHPGLAITSPQSG